MQLMPASAKRAASMRGLAYRQNDLTANPSYNMQLGMATLADYLERWNGSYVLGIASYNAGPTNVRNWVQNLWRSARRQCRSHRIGSSPFPFPETRNYVQRVIENLEVYRNRLSNTDQRLGILADLYRPSGRRDCSGQARAGLHSRYRDRDAHSREILRAGPVRAAIAKDVLLEHFPIIEDRILS